PSLHSLSLHDALPIFRRVRVSSQCFKRAMRQAAREYDLIDHENRGVRTQKLLDALIKRLSEKNPEEARPKIEAVLAAAGLKLKRSEEHTSELQSRENL